MFESIIHQFFQAEIRGIQHKSERALRKQALSLSVKSAIQVRKAAYFLLLGFSSSLLWLYSVVYLLREVPVLFLSNQVSNFSLLVPISIHSTLFVVASIFILMLFREKNWLRLFDITGQVQKLKALDQVIEQNESHKIMQDQLQKAGAQALMSKSKKENDEEVYSQEIEKRVRAEVNAYLVKLSEDYQSEPAPKDNRGAMQKSHAVKSKSQQRPAEFQTA